MTGHRVTIDQIESAAKAALLVGGASETNAASVARAVASAEAAGNTVCGIYYVPIFVEHMRCGKVDGRADPHVARSGSSILIDARSGFAHPAIEAGRPALVEAAFEQGIAAAAVRNSYNALALAYHVTPLAEAGLIGICVSNAPASVAPPGATASVLGTNPIAFAAPAGTGSMVVVDQSMSAVTKTEMRLRIKRGEPIPVGWAQDAFGKSTTDPSAGLAGSLLPAGGQKGANIALLVEVLAAALTGSNLSKDASSFGEGEGTPPGVGQFIIAVDPKRYSSGFAQTIRSLIESYRVAGIRVPGARKPSSGLVQVDEALWRRLVDVGR